MLPYDVETTKLPWMHFIGISEAMAIDHLQKLFLM
jgi:hypothetical protein